MLNSFIIRTLFQLTMNATAVNPSDCPEVKVPFLVFFIIGVVSLAENLLVVVAVICNRNLHSPMYCFICSLAAFNTIASLTKTWENLMIVFADVGQLEKKGSSETKLDDVMDSLLCMSFVGSIFSFLAIAVDRYVCKTWICTQKCFWLTFTSASLVYLTLWEDDRDESESVLACT